LSLLAGAAGSISLMMRAGSNQRSILLILLFSGWVVSPFLGLALANMRIRSTTPVMRNALYGAMLGVTFISLSIYGLHSMFPAMKAGFISLVVPGACWVLIGVALATAFVFSPKER